MEYNNTESLRSKPIVLLVLDGWGVKQAYEGNAITEAQKPYFDELILRYPSMTLEASNEAVGLPNGIFGNSEVGHLNLGAGRVVYQDIEKINKSIEVGDFFVNEQFLKAIEHVKNNNSQLHLCGLVSNGCVHSSMEHLKALLKLVADAGLDKQVFVHAFLDGRDTIFNSGATFLTELEAEMNRLNVGKIATVSGRFYSMDRDNHWERVNKAYLAMTQSLGNFAINAVEAVEQSYEKKIYDEEFLPTVITNNAGEAIAKVCDNDAVIFFNYRADRARELTKAFVLEDFDKIERDHKINNLFFVTFSEYESGLPINVAYPPVKLTETLGEVISKAGLKQLRIAETEKYAHVTYFFNGGAEEPNIGEDRMLVPSPRIASYDAQPEMSAAEVTDKVLQAIDSKEYDFILVNFANADMVGHTGNLEAAIKAIEALDYCLSKVVKAILNNHGVALITADHGNADMMLNTATGQIIKEHTTNPVPFVIVGNQFEGHNLGMAEATNSDLSLLKPIGALCDVAPTILKLMNLEQPEVMTGHSLI